MNFLAHFHLAWPDDMLLLGALEGEYHRGPLRGELPQRFEQGIALHRAIDAYTDRHQSVHALRPLFQPPLRRFAGILIDLAFDHLLHQNWHRFGPLPVEEFSERVYDVLRAGRPLLSNKAKQMADRLTDYDLLSRYAEWETIPASAARIGNRFRRGNPLEDVDTALRELLPELQSSFLAFYPDLIEFSTLTRNRQS